MYLQQTIGKDVTEWERHGKPKDRLYRGSQLKDAKAWARRNTPNEREAAFLQVSAIRQTRSRLSVVTICFLVVLLLLPAGLQIQQLLLQNSTTVTTLADNGLGSLRQAIFAAKPGGTITFDANLRGVIKLWSELSIHKNLILRGPGAGHLSIIGSGDFNVILVKQGVTATISGLAFNGTRQTEGGMGIIYNDGTLTLTSSTVSGNSTSDGNGKPVLGNGGGIFNVNGGTLTLINSTVSDNTAGYGGGIDNGYSGNREAVSFDSGSTLTLTNSTISDNRAMDGGGIITNAGSSATLSFCTIYGNSATGKRDAPLK